MDLWKLWPTIQTKERVLMSDEQEPSSKLTEAQTPSAGYIYHTYSSYARDIDMLNSTYHYLDLDSLTLVR